MGYAIDPNETETWAAPCLTCMGAGALRGAPEGEVCPVCEGSKLHGATFTFGRMPGGLWREIVLKKDSAKSQAYRRAIRQLDQEGDKDPNPELVETMAKADRAWLEEDERLGIQCVRWTVKGHAGLTFRDGTEAPFASEEATFTMWDGQIAKLETIKLYRANLALWALLLEATWSHHSLTADQKKSSRSD